MDGGANHPMIQGDRLATMRRLMDGGVGLVCLHYAVEVPKGKAGDSFLEWLGGYYETGYSTNPHWTAEIKALPDHPITRGVRPFSILDEWYFSIRFRPDMKGVTPIVVARPDDATRQGTTPAPRKALPAHRRRERARRGPGAGPSSGPTAAEASASPGHTSTRTGETPTSAPSS